MTVKIAEDWKSTVAFWLALTATLCGIVSATVDVTNVVKDHQCQTIGRRISLRLRMRADVP